ncbi:MAG: hypothetical protein RJA22_1342 [Verrucomicrobiota bacterium]|jgi:hypothetical protein
MRTKSIILTLAVGAMSVASSMAQVYSVNAVGYVNITCNPGFNMIANQLNPTSSTLEALIPNAPPGSQIFKFTGTGYNIATFDEFDLAWTYAAPATSANMALTLGRGVWFNNAGTTPFTVTFLGEVPQGTLTTPTPTGFNMVASQVPQAGPVDTLGLTGGPGDQIYRFANPGGYTVYTFDEFDLAWLPSVPSLNVGEAVWLSRAPGSPTSWTRTFSVN